MLSVVAVDDEALALRRLEIAISQMADAELIGKARSGRDGMELIRRLKPDVVLLDIQMSGFGGFDLLDSLEPEELPLVIFVTAFESFAARAFEVSAVDYVLKPVEFERLSAALARARRNLQLASSEQRARELRDVVAHLRGHNDAGAERDETFAREFWAQRRGDFVRVPVEHLDWIEAERDYVRLHARGQAYILRATLANMASRLDPALFVRIRRSALIRADRIEAVRKPNYGDYRVVLTSGQELRVGKTYLKSVRDLIATTAAQRG
ncbi:LytR/AlgR family response regulator transcription factor [Caulobacter sp. NIBR2454]|uniref:LytR/AlgR family response regulator transcription factor n=1 Tax=Caulobacter sp. NIBR2454 TaxID=3015996 RepID=UPI0022B659B2|nr:LytTR family DNA-binding domain-containing protein [Caulobacter sp. NIBR2454]